MKNKTIRLDEVVPEKIRFSVYKKVLEILKTIKNNKSLYGMSSYDNSFGLCLLLPCVLWNINYLDDAPYGENWNWHDVPDAFPEVADGIKIIESAKSEDKPQLRIQILEEIINNQKK